MQGFVVQSRGRLGPTAKKFIDKAVAECDMAETAKGVVTSKMLRAIGIELMHKQAFTYMSKKTDSHVDSRAE